MSDEGFNLSEFVGAATTRVREIATATRGYDLDRTDSPNVAHADVTNAPLKEIAEVYLLLDEFLPIEEFASQEVFDALPREEKLARNLRSQCSQVLALVSLEVDDFGQVLANVSNDSNSPDSLAAQNIAKALSGARELESRRSITRELRIA